MQFQRLSPCGALGLRARRRWAALGKYARKGGRSQTGVLLWAAVLVMALFGVLPAACGGGDGSDATGTPAGEREGRTAAVEQAEAQEVGEEGAAQAEAAEADASAQVQSEAVAQESESQAGPQAVEEAEAVEAEVEDESEQTITFEGELVERIAAALAEHRAGLAVERNVLGDPSAPVLIVEYGDFQ